MRILLSFLFFLFLGETHACRVLDPELQDSYAGGCRNGLAHGKGSATGTAEYVGEFRDGRKHGHGVKTWPNGDRYAGDFVDDRKEGLGEYRFGRGPWAGERYEGEFLADRRHGHGRYRWASGDVYEGPWREDAATGPPTQMMQARAVFEREALDALSPGRIVCKRVVLGIAHSRWIRGTVVRRDGKVLVVRIGDALIQDAALEWTPCW